MPKKNTVKVDMAPSSRGRGRPPGSKNFFTKEQKQDLKALKAAAEKITNEAEKQGVLLWLAQRRSEFKVTQLEYQKKTEKNPDFRLKIVERLKTAVDELGDTSFKFGIWQSRQQHNENMSARTKLIGVPTAPLPPVGDPKEHQDIHAWWRDAVYMAGNTKISMQERKMWCGQATAYQRAYQRLALDE